MIGEISAALSSLKTVSELAKTASSMANYGELLSAVNTVQEKLSQALLSNALAAEKHSQLLDENRRLRADMAALQEWEGKAADYRLAEVARGIFAYICLPAAETTIPRHWVCASCFQSKRISILQEDERVAYRCPACRTSISPFKDGGLVRIEGPYIVAG